MMRRFQKRMAAEATALGFLVVVALSFARTLTYVSTSDPGNYVTLARQLLDLPRGSAAWHAALTQMSPFHPWLLALSIRLFGLNAPYWTNFVLSFIWVIVLARLYRRLAGARGEAVLLLTTAGLLLFGFPLNIHFLLYPFREMPAFLFLTCGLLAFFKGRQEHRPGLLPLAGVCYLLGAAAREPTILGLAGPVLVLLADRGVACGKRLRNLALLLSPLAVALAVWCIVLLRSGPVVTGQMFGWFWVVFHTGGGDLVPRALSNAGQYAHRLMAEAGWAGLALGAIGSWHLRRRGEVLLCFALPAVLVFGFYSLYQVQWRYLLAVVLLLAPLMGFGALHAVDLVTAVLRRRAGTRAAALAFAGALLVTFAALVSQALSLDPMGPCYSRRDLKDFRETLTARVGTNDQIFAEHGCRYAQAALLHHTDLRLGDTIGSSGGGAAGRRIFFLAPRNDACYSTAAVPHNGVRTAEQLWSLGDLRSPAPDGRRVLLGLGAARFELLEVVPRALRQVREPLPPGPDRMRAIWLDFRDAAPAAPKCVRVRAADGALQYEWPPWRGNGLAPFYVPPGVLTRAEALLEVTSTEPLPAQLLAAVQTDREAASFPLDNGRRLSAVAWFPPPSAIGKVEDAFGVALEGRGALCLPAPPGTTNLTMAVALVLRPTRREGYANLRVQCEGRELNCDRLDLRRGELVCKFRAPVPAGARTMRLVLDVQAEEAGPLSLCVKAVNIAWSSAEGHGKMPPPAAPQPRRLSP